VIVYLQVPTTMRKYGRITPTYRHRDVSAEQSARSSVTKYGAGPPSGTQKSRSYATTASRSGTTAPIESGRIGLEAITLRDSNTSATSRSELSVAMPELTRTQRQNRTYRGLPIREHGGLAPVKMKRPHEVLESKLRICFRML
jgi:hypothetical protein